MKEYINIGQDSIRISHGVTCVRLTAIRRLYELGNVISLCGLNNFRSLGRLEALLLHLRAQNAQIPEPGLGNIPAEPGAEHSHQPNTACGITNIINRQGKINNKK